MNGKATMQCSNKNCRQVIPIAAARRSDNERDANLYCPQCAAKASSFSQEKEEAMRRENPVIRQYWEILLRQRAA